MSSHISGHANRNTSLKIKSLKISISVMISNINHAPVGKPSMPRKKKVVMKLYV